MSQYYSISKLSNIVTTLRVGVEPTSFIAWESRTNARQDYQTTSVSQCGAGALLHNIYTYYPESLHPSFQIRYFFCPGTTNKKSGQNNSSILTSYNHKSVKTSWTTERMFFVITIELLLYLYIPIYICTILNYVWNGSQVLNSTILKFVYDAKTLNLWLPDFDEIFIDKKEF